ncbi:sigma-70 family RNA polymerase sigma factor [Leifsonia sp. PS1209]|uniref:RNA polymerase sigma factor n=1 Tax=Leifsonia sp. PS1209 TaxID=2724914 RepID=UPI001442E04D|nr:sigma-70 family RNA polymerase sigma factor [Leifsonia sp. PS1209]QJA00145.1 sigma-70 family RNA polymerase sigma factor [Leifsonia sp. PS1209]
MTHPGETSYLAPRSSQPSEMQLGPVDDLGDDLLIALVRAGECQATEAFAELWKRHLPAALAAARRITLSYEAADLASEAFARVLVSLQAGRGPDLSFRAYLIVTMRNVAAGWARHAARLTLQEYDDLDDLPQTSTGLDRLDRLAGFEAFRSLPERWRKALWYSEVEDLSPAELGEVFGISSSAAAMLAFRARQGLRKAWESSKDADGHPAAMPPVRSPSSAPIGSSSTPNS